jgi:hypothetical protein
MKGLVVSNTLVLEAAAFASIAGLLLLASIAVLAVRTRRLPICWRCGVACVRRSHSHHVWDNFARAALLHPYRCEKCLLRFYGFKSRRVPRHGARSKAAAGGR